MFGHYLPNKNESATVAQNPKFPQLNTATNKICKRVTNIFVGFIEFGYPATRMNQVAGDGKTNEHLPLSSLFYTIFKNRSTFIYIVLYRIYT